MFALVVGACAQVGSLSGGPADTTPPALVETSPADGATNVTGRTVRLTFSERLDAGAAEAVTVAPMGDVAPEVVVKAREVVVTLPEPRDSTTYVVSVGTGLRDQRGVALRTPITVAFATGDRIDRGRIDGAVRRPDDGRGVGSLAVWAYALADSTGRPDPRSEAPDYRTETGADGAFRLDYLRPGAYFVAAVADANRNGRADPGERFAAPPGTLRADTTAARAAFWVTSLDTIPPVAQRARALSDRRVAVRFSESVRLAGVPALALADSASGAAVPVTWYQPTAGAFEVYGETAAPLTASRHVVTYAPGDAIADSAGLAPDAFRLSFSVPTRVDTVAARFVAFEPAGLDSVGTLRRGQRPAVRFSAPPGELLSRVVLEADGVRQSVAFVSDDGVTFRPDSLAALPARFRLAAPVGDSAVAQRFTRPDRRDVGAVVGRVSGAAAWVEARAESGVAVAVPAGADGAFVIDGLLPGTYRVRAWSDLDGDGQWSGGSLAPFVAPEPLALVAEPAQVRARWETEVAPISL